MARTAESELVPIWRTSAQPAVLYAVTHFDGPTAADVARRFGLPRQQVATEVRRLERAGILRARTMGRSRALSLVEDHPAATALRSLAELTVGPLVDLVDLYDIPGVDRVIVFGSWARRHLGEPGPTPRDLDVLVVGDADAYAVTSACLDLSGRHGIEVSPMVVSAAEANRPAPSTILDDVMRQPRVEVHRERAHENVPGATPT